LYVGQDHHISYFPHLNADQYWPKGWDELKNKFPKDYCTYTGAAGGQDKTLCTQGGSHAWKTASTDVSQLIACVAEPKYEPDAPFRGYLSGKNTAESGNYTFQRVRVNFDDGCGDCNYDDIMINECKKIGMKPLCDHPSYCKTDPKVVYIGQDNHIAHTPHRNHNGYFPEGWEDIKSLFPKTFCTYTGSSNGRVNTLCTRDSGSHAWQTVKTDREFMCASAPPYVQDDPFEGELGEKNGNEKGVYKFQKIRTKEVGGNYDELMIAECAKVDMKPLCDHPSYCKNDVNVVYIGQTNHIALLPHLNENSYFPSGWNELKQKFPKHFCTYTGQNGGRDKTLCTNGNSHAWQPATRGYQDIMCVLPPEYEKDDPFQGELGSKDGTDAGLYKFQRVRAQASSGNYDTIMINECSKLGMKPLCEHPSYCKSDARALYIGQSSHLAHPHYRGQDSYFPSGWSDLKGKFPTTFCSFTGPHGGQSVTLCTRGSSHAWQTVAQNKEILCAKAPPYKPDLPFSGILGEKAGSTAGLYKFQRVRTNAVNGDYDDIMVSECEKKGMQPLCDHPSYCKTDPKSVYIGQTNHIAHTPHRNNDAYFPAGWDELKSKFPDKFCTYTAHHGSSAKSLCTENRGSHGWQAVSGNREIMCAKAPQYKPDDPFEGELDSKNEANAGTYKFQRVRVKATSGNYDTVMKDECSKKGMKPLCDHPSYCRNDANTVYIGQNNHIAHIPHLNQDSYFPKGWSELKGKFPKSFCAYTGNHGGAQKTLCTSGASHSWQDVNGHKDIMCAKAPAYKPDAPFSGDLGSKNGADSGEYTFQKIRIEATSGNYDTVMINECGKKGMKPLCDHPSYCKTDLRAVYIGQDNHMAYPPHRNSDGYFPSGWSELKQKFPEEFCAFTGPHGGASVTLCTNAGSHGWYNINTKSFIMCAKAPPYQPDDPFEGKLDDKNGIDAGVYKFQRIRVDTTSGNYDTIMVNTCAKLKMKPLCDHPSYCKADARATYIGQTNHIAYGPHRSQDSYFPQGWSELKGKFPADFCTFTGPHGGQGKTLCTSGSSHAWRTPAENREVMCVKAPPYEPDPPFSGDLGSRNAANAGKYTFQRIRLQQTSGNYDTIMINECGKKINETFMRPPQLLQK